ncbi:MAG: hypothetical protein RL291_61 [Pseudomonadota bacterium]|jgi:hypothetical protein
MTRICPHCGASMAGLSTLAQTCAKARCRRTQRTINRHAKYMPIKCCRWCGAPMNRLRLPARAAYCSDHCRAERGREKSLRYWHTKKRRPPTPRAPRVPIKSKRERDADLPADVLAARRDRRRAYMLEWRRRRALNELMATQPPEGSSNADCGE